MRRLMLVAMVLVLVLVLPDAARAQRRHSPRLREVTERSANLRKGFWLSAGLGTGAESFDANDGLGWSDDTWGGVVSLRLGGTVSQSVLLGAELTGWEASYDRQQYDRGLGSLLFIAQWYPARRGAFFLKGGAGLAYDHLDLHYTPVTPTRTNQRGTALEIGLGYDIRVGRMVSLTPTFDVVGQYYDGHQERLLNLGLAVTFH